MYMPEVVERIKEKKWAVYIIVVIYTLLAFRGLYFLYEIIHYHLTDQKGDFIAIYALVHSVANQEDLTALCSTLIEKYTGYKPNGYNFTTPHSAMMFLFFPFLLFLEFHAAKVFWIIGELLCVYIFFKIITNLKWYYIIFLILLIINVFTVNNELMNGQVHALLLLFIAVMYRCFNQGKNSLGGIILGLTLLLKPLLSPVFLLLIIYKKFNAVFATLATFVVGHLVLLPIVGFQYYYHYYLHALPKTSRFFDTASLNFSIWTLGAKAFSGSESTFDTKYDVLIIPIIQSDLLTDIFTYLIPLLVMGIISYVAWKSQHFKLSFALFITFSTVLSPVSWLYYFILLLFPLTLLLQDYFDSVDAVDFMLLITSIFLLAIGIDGIRKVLIILFGFHNDDGVAMMHFLPSLFMYLPVFAILLICFVIMKVSNRLIF